MKTFKLKLTFLTLVLAAVFLSVMGCNEDTVTTNQSDNLEISSMSTSDSTDTGILILSEVKILVKDIKLNVSASGEDSANFKVGPYVLYLNMNSNVNIIGSAFIPVGTYDKVRFMIHKLGDSEPVPDPDFADVNGRYSVVVKGTYAGVSFVFKSDKSAHQKLTFPGSLQVSASGKSNITIQARPYIWFIKNGVYLDPTNTANWSDIENNIKDNINNNFKAFKDNDKNGMPD